MIHVIQCLCPDRHCIFGMAYDPADISPEEAMQGFREVVQPRARRKREGAGHRESSVGEVLSIDTGRTHVAAIIAIFEIIQNVFSVTCTF